MTGDIGFVVRPNRPQVVKTQINAEVMGLFQEQQHQQVVSIIIMDRIRIMNRP